MVIVLVFTAIVSLIRVAFNLGYYYSAFECVTSPDLTCAVTFEGSFFMGTTLGLCLLTLGLWSRRSLGFLLSFIALIWIGLVYILWYRGTLSVMKMAEVEHFSQLPNQHQYFLPLIEATWWDIAVLVLALIVFIWQAWNTKRILEPVATVSKYHPT
jgi:hypothetical protein